MHNDEAEKAQSKSQIKYCGRRGVKPMNKKNKRKREDNGF